MRDYLRRLPKEIRDLISLAGKVASGKKMRVYLVGGFVRDLLLGVDNFDLDIVVEGDGIEFAESLGPALKGRVIRHRRFGTATVALGSRFKIDVATARKETYPHPAHLPVVKKGTLKDDLFRRDFTINAMAVSINRDDFGRLKDFFGGSADLKKKRVRILHNLSFIDDPTRILRAVRFEQRFNFKIEAGTLKRLKEAVDLKMLNKLEPQRVRDDLILVLKEKGPLKEIKRFQQLTGFGFISRKLRLSAEQFRFLRDAERVIASFRKDYPQRRELDAWLIYFIALVSSLSLKALEGVCQRFAFRRGESKRVLSYKKITPRLISKFNKAKVSPPKIYSFFEPLSYEVILLLKAKYKNKRYFQEYLDDFFEIYNGMRVCVSGEDLCRMGIAPGPRYRKIFIKVLEAKLKGLVRTKEEELAMIRSYRNVNKA